MQHNTLTHVHKILLDYSEILLLSILGKLRISIKHADVVRGNVIYKLMPGTEMGGPVKFQKQKQDNFVFFRTVPGAPGFRIFLGF